MKNKLYRVLVMLLVVAMAIPAFALAEGEAITADPKDYKATLTRDQAHGTTVSVPNVITITGLKDGVDLSNAYVKWASSDASVSLVWDQTGISSTTEEGKTTYTSHVPSVTVNSVTVEKPAKATLTGTLYVDLAATTAKVEIPVEFTAVDLKEFKFAQEKYTFREAKKQHNFLNELVLTNPDEGTASFAAKDAEWKITKGDEFATIDEFGKMTFLKAGEVTLQATIPGSKLAPATCTVTIVAGEDSEEEKESYKSLSFTAANFGTEKGYIDLSDYVNKSPKDTYPMIEDKLNWFSSDVTIATVTNDGVVSFNKKDTPVTITVQSKNDPTVKAECKVIYSKAAAKPYKTLSFNPETVTITRGDTFDALDYLTYGPKDANDYLIWTSDDLTVATVDAGWKDIVVYEFEYDGVIYDFPEGIVVGYEPYATITGLKAGTAHITVRSDADPSLTKTLTVEVKKVESAFSKVEFTQKSLKVNEILKDEPFALGNYLLTEDGFDDDLVWTVDNQQIALVDGPFLYIKKAGTVVVTARSYLDPSKTASITIEIEKVDVPFTKITLTQKEFKLTAPYAPIFLGRYVVTEPADAVDELVFTSDDTDILTVDKGYVYPNKEYIEAKLYKSGTVHVTVRSKLNPDVKDQFTFILEEVDDLKSIKFVDVPKQFAKSSKDFDLSQYVVTDPVDYDGVKLWESSDPQVATVDNTGKLAFVKPGTVTITVSSKDGKISASCTIEMVDNNKVEKLTLKPLTLKVGELFDLNKIVKAEPYEACFDLENLYWVSSDRHVAELINGGYEEFNGIEVYTGDTIFALEAGKTKLTAYYKNLDGTVIQSEPVTVKVIENKMTDVRISKNQYTLKLNTKTTGKILFNTVPFDAEWYGNDIYVESSDPTVVEVTGWGKKLETKDGNKGCIDVTALKPGAAKITVYSAETNKALDVTKVIVKKVAVKSAKLPVKEIKLYWYDDGTGGNMPVANRLYQNQYKLTPIVMPSTAYYKVSYETSDPSVAFVRDQESLGSNDSSDSATIVASGEGKCKITVKISDGKKVITKTLKVVVLSKKPAVKMSKTKATIKMVEGGDNTLQLRAYNADTDKDVKVTWTTSDKKVAKVDAKGVVTAVGAGKAVISATTKDNYKITVTCTVTVKADKANDEKKVAVKEIEVAKKTAVKVGAKKTLEVNVKPAKATNKNVSFKSSDPSIVTVDKNGKIKGISAGEATITITAKDGSGVTAKVKVIVKK